MNIESLYQFLLELDKLKSVYRRSYLTDVSRNENSAEHSWHLAMALLLLEREVSLEIDLLKTLKMVLIHDVCEIGAGDVSVFSKERAAKTEKEQTYINTLSQNELAFTSEIKTLWQEYEAQETPESQWVKILDRLLPFMLNMATGGKAWIEQSVTRSQVVAINQTAFLVAPEIYEWILKKIDVAVGEGWLIDG